MYTYYPRESKCTTESLNDPFHPFAVPPTSEYSRREYLGASIPRLGVRVDSFHYGEDGNDYIIIIINCIIIIIYIIAYFILRSTSLPWVLGTIISNR